MEQLCHGCPGHMKSLHYLENLTQEAGLIGMLRVLRLDSLVKLISDRTTLRGSVSLLLSPSARSHHRPPVLLPSRLSSEAKTLQLKLLSDLLKRRIN
uniref:Uncharacterized protein n=1 Tax=Knipowitschia caucasica TaxID=637954 RepID=A0AAV2L6R0_KNICA